MRVNDILSELTRQLGPMERQAETARIYLKKKEELKTLDVNLFLLDYERIAKELKETGEKQAQCAGRIRGDEGALRKGKDGV